MRLKDGGAGKLVGRPGARGRTHLSGGHRLIAVDSADGGKALGEAVFQARVCIDQARRVGQRASQAPTPPALPLRRAAPVQSAVRGERLSRAGNTGIRAPADFPTRAGARTTD